VEREGGSWEGSLVRNAPARSGTRDRTTKNADLLSGQVENRPEGKKVEGKEEKEGSMLPGLLLLTNKEAAVGSLRAPLLEKGREEPKRSGQLATGCLRQHDSKAEKSQDDRMSRMPEKKSPLMVAAAEKFKAREAIPAWDRIGNGMPGRSGRG